MRTGSRSAIANQYLRWTDNPLLDPGVPLRLSLGYKPDGFEQMFVGEIVSEQATFPADGLPTLTIAAQDRFERLRESVRSLGGSRSRSRSSRTGPSPIR